jgi:hypothetical protein
LNSGRHPVAAHRPESPSERNQNELHGDSMTGSVFYVYPVGA